MVSRGWTLVAPGGATDLCAQVKSPGVTLFRLSGGDYRTCAAGAVPGEPGRGYWVYAADESTLALPSAAADRPVAVSLKKGWNLIGNPFAAAVPWDGRVRVNGIPLTELQGVLSLPYDYVTATGAYRTVRILQPGKGYAIRANEDCTLVLPLPDDTGQGITFEPVAASRIVADPETGDYVAGQVVALRAAGASDAQARSRAAALGFSVLGFNSYLGLYQIGLPSGVSEQQAAADLAATAEFESASRHRVLAPGAYVPNDPPYQGGPAEQRWGFERVRAPQAWTEVVPVGPTVAVIDTGVDPAHADLSGKVANGADFIAAGGDGTTDPSGHGTHVAGVIAARGDNATGMAGVCWGCDIMPVRVCDAGACPFFSVLNGITYAANNGARVINISLETTAVPGSPEWDIFQNVIDYAVSTGAFVVAAAGNSGYSENTIPAALDGVFGASAVDKTDYPATFANSSSIVDIYAPGVSIYSTEPGGAEGMRDGTSMSAAFVSGAAGLLAALSPTISNTEIEKTLRDTADAMVVAPQDKAGRLNIGAAAAAFGIPNSPPVVDALTLSSQDANPGQTVNINVQAHDPDGDALGYTWTISGGALSNGTTPDTVWTAPATPGEYVLTVTVSDGRGGNATARGIVRSGLSGIRLLRIYPRMATINRGEIVTFQAIGHFSDGRIIPVQPHWELKNGLGVISSDGKFTATETGVETIRALLGPRYGEQTVGIETGLPAPALTPSAMNPQPATNVNITNANFIVVGQLNAAGRKDFVAITGGGTQNIVHINNGGYTYVQSNTPDSTWGYMGALGDLDSDGDLDLVEAVQNPGGGVYVYEYNAGVFTRRYILSPGENIKSVDIRDMDNNASLDIVAGTAGTASGKPIIFWNDGVGNLASRFLDADRLEPNTTSCASMHVAVGDINNDSYADIVRVCLTPGVASEYALNQKNQTFAAGVAMAGTAQESAFAMLADVNGDDNLDYVALRYSNPDEGFTVYTGNGAGAFAFSNNTATWTSMGGSGMFDMADMDNDGDLDIISAPNNPGVNSDVFVNNGAGAFATATAGMAANSPCVVAGDLGDPITDNSPDVLVAPTNAFVWQNSIANSAQPPAPTNLTHEIGATETHFEWDWSPGGETTSAALVTFDFEISHFDGAATTTFLSSINPERLGEIGHATRTGNTYGYTYPVIPFPTGIITWKVRAVDNMFQRSAATTATIGCPEVSSLDDSGFSTLRDCIDYANNAAATGTVITFHDTIAGGTISPVSELPAISNLNGNVVEIYGGNKNITLDGSLCPAVCSGLTVGNNATVIQSLNIMNFPDHGIYINQSGSSSTIGGGRGVGEGNVIGGNGAAGILIESAFSVNIHGNAIGTNYGAATGTVNLGNLYGIWLRNSVMGGSIGNQIGDVSMDEDLGNTIAYNTTNGIYITKPVAGFMVDSNLNSLYANSIYSNGGVADKGIRISDAQHGNIQPPTITDVVCGSGADLYDVEVSYTNITVEQALIYFYRADNNAPAITADNNGEGYKYLAVFTGQNATGAIIETFNDVPFDSSNGQYLTSYRYNAGSAPFNSQGFSEFGNNYDMSPVSCGTCPGWVVTTNADSGVGSLRECMTLANSTAGAQTITFNNNYTIQPASELPALTDATGGTTIDGTGRTIVIDGQNTAAFDGIQIDAATNTIKKLTIINFNGALTDAGIRLTTTGAHGNTITGCYIGVDSGGIMRPNTDGIVIQSGAHDNVIGGDTAGERNYISGNDRYGIDVNQTQYNVITGNYIGLNPAGAAAVPNGNQGVRLYDGANYNRIGGTNAGEGNYISGQSDMFGSMFAGIDIDSSNYNTVYGNIIGLSTTGAAIPNEFGVWVTQGSKYNIIGGDTAAKRNILSGNNSYGIRLDTNNTKYNVVKGNYIGTSVDGVSARPNSYGISIENGPSYNVIGGPGQGNIISGNSNDGILITSGPTTATEYNVVQGNIIGLNTNNTALKNNVFGIHIVSNLDTGRNLIGGDITTDYNIIAGNGKAGIGIDQISSDANMVWGNYIGVLSNGTTYRPNEQHGIFIEQESQGNFIGSATNTLYGNVIAGNAQDGVHVEDANTDFNTIARNRIYDNGESGIDLELNGNQDIAYPDITGSTFLGGSSYDVAGTGGAGCVVAGCRVELFKVDDTVAGVDKSDLSGRGEAYEYVGSATTIAGGAWSFSNVTITNATKVTATITNAAGSTSEYAINETLSIAALPCVGWQVTSNADSGAGSLRECITEANTDPAANTITFAIANQTISPVSELPAITDDGTVIDGGAQNITIDGAACAGCDGIIFSFADDGGVKNLIIGNFITFNKAGIRIFNASGTIVTGCYIGNDGSLPLANSIGIQFNTGTNSIIGGDTAAERNIISGNDRVGINLASGENNRIIGNYIGTDNTGLLALPNGVIGVQISDYRNVIGGTASGEGNVISGNTSYNITIYFPENQILGNYIGLTADGNGSFPVVGAGIMLFTGATDNIIGGDTVAERNIISGTSSTGIKIEGGADFNVISGNYIGTNAAGTAALPNSIGIWIDLGANNNTIGGDGSLGEGNLISGNTTAGIVVDGATTSNNNIYGNSIGTNAAVTAALGNGIGVKIQNGAASTSIGADIADYGNAISGNNTHGIVLDGAAGVGIYGNGIGMNTAGTVSIGNTQNGILISAGSTGVIVGGDSDDERNFISANGGHGIEINAVSGAQIYGNYIGTIFDGSNPALNGGNGIYITNNSDSNRIGDDVVSSPPNVIAFNGGEGVEIDAGCDFNTLTRNVIHSHSSGLGINLNNGNQNIAAPSTTNVAKDPGVFVYDVDVTVPATTGVPVQCNAGSPCTLEMFIADSSVPNVPSDPAGGEAYKYANASYTMNACAAMPCSISWPNVDLTAFVGGGNSTTITTTITDNLGNTSEFSSNFVLPSDTTCPVVSVNTDSTSPVPVSSLRDCIQRANSAGGAYKSITFDPAVFTPGTTIQLASALPEISTSSVTIRNTTGGEINIRGTGLGVDCVRAVAPIGATGDITGIVIENLTIINCRIGIYFNDLAVLDGFMIRNATIKGNYIGTNQSGAAGIGNSYGLYMSFVADSTFENNVISGNSVYAVDLNGDDSDNNVIIGNYVGVDPTGMNAIPNGNGVMVRTFASFNRIGGTTAAERNIISGNTGNGVEIALNIVTGNRTIGNYIGTNKNGDAAIPNGNGVRIWASTINNPIGGTGAGEGNLISGNTNYGVYVSESQVVAIYGNKIGADLNGNCTGLGNGNSGIFFEDESLNNVIGGFGANESNTIACNGGDGVAISDGTAHGLSIRGNVIYNNTDLAINLINGGNNGIAAPVISAVEFTGPATVYATGTACATCNVDLYWADNINPPGPGPSITADAAGEAYRFIGSTISSATGTWAYWNIPVTARAMYITANATDMDLLDTDSSEFAANRPPNTCPVVSSLADSGYNTLRECITQANNNGVPVTITFDAAIANGTINIAPIVLLPSITADGVIVDGTTRNITIDGTPVCVLACDGFTLDGDNGGIKNLNIVGFSGGVGCGVKINGNNNTVSGNKIGNNGVAAIANSNGVCLENTASNNVIGGDTAAERNIISGNGFEGVVLSGAGVTGNNIIGNYIGVNAAGTGALTNLYGILMNSGANNNTVGGSAPGEANLIARNFFTGILLNDAGTIQNTFSRNRIYSTMGLGISLFTPGTNNDIAPPTFTNVTQTGATTFNVWGTTAGCAAPCTVELFRVDDTVAGVGQDPSLAGEAYAYLDTENTTATGSFAFWGADVSGGSYFTATVTDANGNTSEFALNIEATNDPPTITSVTFDNGAGSPAIPPDGVSQVTIIVTATDPNGLADLDYAEIDMTLVNATLGIVLLYDTGVAGAGVADDGIFAGVATAAPGTPVATYTLTATVYDDWGLSDTATQDLGITNEPPEVTNAKATPSAVLPGLAGVIFSADVWDNNGLGDIVSVTIDLTLITGPGNLALNNMGGGYYETAPYTIPALAPFGSYVLTVTATDAAGATGTATFTLDIGGPPSVNLVTFTPNSLPPDGVTSALIEVYVDDPDGVADITAVGIDLTPVNTTLGFIPLADSGIFVPGLGQKYTGNVTVAQFTAAATYTLTAYATDTNSLTDTGDGDLNVQNVPPVVVFATATPYKVIAGYAPVTFYADVTDDNGLTDITSVTIDLTTITGVAALTLYDDGTNGDTVAGDGRFSFSPYTIPLTATTGIKILTVNAEDAAAATGEATTSINISGGPIINQITFTPPSLPPDGVTSALIEVYVDDPDGPGDIAAVSIDLTPVNAGLGVVVLVDSGTYVPGLGEKYTGTAIVAVGTTAATYTLTASATDTTGLNDTDTGDLGVENDPPVITFATATPYNVIPGYAPVTFYADVTDGNGLADIDSVTVNLSTINGPAAFTLYDDGSNGDTAAGDGRYTFSPYTIPAAAAYGIKSLTFTADDGTDTDTETVNIRINTPMTIVSMSFSPDTIAPDGAQTTNLTIDIRDVDAQTDISTVFVNLGSVGSVPAIRSLAYSGPAGADTYRYVLNGILPQAGWPLGTYYPFATATDIFGRQAYASDALTLTLLRPKPPVLQNVQSSSSTVEIRWTSPYLNTDNSALANLAGHNLYRRLYAGAYGAPLYVDATTATNTLIIYTDNTVTDFETYCYRATAFNASGLESDPSSEMCVTVYPPAWVFQQVCGDPYAGGFQPPSTPGFFNRPTDITTDNDGNIFVADTDNHRIQKFDKFCVYKGSRGGFGNTPGKFKNPTGITYNAVTGFLYVVDQYNRIQVFDTTDSLNVMPGQFTINSPISITAAPDGTLYISQNIVDIFTHYTAAGVFIEQWAVNEPRGSDLDSAGNVYVASIGDHKIYKITGGALAYYIGGPGNGPREFSTPYDIAIDKADDTMFIADAGNNRIDVYDSGGNLVNIIGSYGNNFGYMINPTGVHISPFGSLSPLYRSLLVADKMNQRIQEFGPPGS